MMKDEEENITRETTEPEGVDAQQGQDQEEASSQEALPAPEDNSGSVLRDFFADCYVQYSSYVVRDRAIPDVDDGFKPVQRRILFCMHRADDGRYNKVAGIVGDTMHFHPHGDASIGGALTVLANKEYYIDKQGNFGNIFTGMPAAAPRYIECRLTELAKETLFNSEITDFVDTYDGRQQEPVRFPAKVPSLLMLGSDGIAAGMATHIFPHNFCELLQAQINILKQEPFQVLPDFLQGGLMDASEYADGAGFIKVRARIEADGDKKLVIREVPPGTTTETVIDSIEAAAKRGKVKISSITDLTAEKVNIEIALQRGVYAEETLKELYAYTNCEVRLVSDFLVIQDNVPVVLTVSEVLKRNTAKLVEYLRRELELAIHQLQEKVLEKTLAQIFVENRIYKRIENCKSLELIFAETRKGLEKFKHLIYREILDEDIEKLLQIPIRRISAFDIAKNEQEVANLNSQLADKQNKLANLTNFAIEYIRHLLEKYGELYPRHTEITAFTSINAKEVARRDVKVFFDRQGHFIGTNVKPSNKDAAPLVLTEFDKVAIIRGDGTCKVMDIPEKEYVGMTKFLLSGDKDKVYCMLYRHKTEGTWYAKRFKLGAYLLGKEYHLVPDNCIVEELYNREDAIVQLEVTSKTRRVQRPVIVDFLTYDIRAKEARGFKITSNIVDGVKVLQREASSEEPKDDGPKPPDGGGASSGPEAPVPESGGGAANPAPASKTPLEEADKKAEDNFISDEKPPRMFQMSLFDDL